MFIYHNLREAIALDCGIQTLRGSHFRGSHETSARNSVPTCFNSTFSTFRSGGSGAGVGARHGCNRRGHRHRTKARGTAAGSTHVGQCHDRGENRRDGRAQRRTPVRRCTQPLFRTEQHLEFAVGFPGDHDSRDRRDPAARALGRRLHRRDLSDRAEVRHQLPRSGTRGGAARAPGNAIRQEHTGRRGKPRHAQTFRYLSCPGRHQNRRQRNQGARPCSLGAGDRRPALCGVCGECAHQRRFSRQ